LDFHPIALLTSLNRLIVNKFTSQCTILALVHVLSIFMKFFGFNLLFNFDASCTFIYFLVSTTTIQLMLKSHSMLSQCQLMDVKKGEKNVVFKKFVMCE
jgi:hypothetical protein